MIDDASKQANGIDRRELLKLGAGAGAGAVMGGALTSSNASAQQRDEPMRSGPGWKHTSTRASGNGEMDATSRRIVEYAHAFSASDLTPRLQDAFANTMLDTIASLVSGFESEPARICARLARAQRGDLRSTVLGYGIVTTPELAAYANSSMIRHTDFNDHTSDMIGGVLAVAEAVHASGADTVMAIVLAYQVYGALSGAGGRTEGFDAGIYYAPAGAVAAGKLLGLNEDQLANALSLALTMHIPLRVNRAGTLSMQKGCATADAARSAVFAALAAREGMTGPAEPFEGRDGLWDKIADPPKWDPRNRETADHSLPYEIARALVDGEIWIDSFGPGKLMDPVVRGLIDKITASANPDYSYHGQVRVTVRRKDGNELVRELGRNNTGISLGTPVTHDEIVAKFNRVFAFMKVSEAQRLRAFEQWSNLRGVRDIAEPLGNLARFGSPAPL